MWRWQSLHQFNDKSSSEVNELSTWRRSMHRTLAVWRQGKRVGWREEKRGHPETLRKRTLRVGRVASESYVISPSISHLTTVDVWSLMANKRVEELKGCAFTRVAAILLFWWLDTHYDVHFLCWHNSSWVWCVEPDWIYCPCLWDWLSTTATTRLRWRWLTRFSLFVSLLLLVFRRSFPFFFFPNWANNRRADKDMQYLSQDWQTQKGTNDCITVHAHTRSRELENPPSSHVVAHLFTLINDKSSSSSSRIFSLTD